MTDEELENINSGNKKFGLDYMGLCPQMKGYLVAISGE
jgi:hypothetical protein